MSTSFRCILKLIARYSLKRTINYFAVTAVFLSICTLFTVNAVFKGFDSELQQLFRGSLADYLVEWNWGGPSLKELEDKDQDHIWSPALDGFGMIKTSRYVSSVSVKGVDPSREAELRKSMNISKIDFSLLEKEDVEQSPLKGFLSAFDESAHTENPTPILVGTVLAEQLHISEGETVKLVLPNWQDNISTQSFKVSGIFKSGIYEDDRTKVYIPMKAASNMIKHPAGFSYLQVAEKGKEGRKFNIEELNEAYPNAQVGSWRERHKFRLRAVAHERKLIALVLSLIVVVSSFGILAIQWSFVQEKTRDIGILRAMGFSRYDIFSIFLGVSWMVGICGLILGLGGGYLISNNANEILQVLQWRPFPGDLYYHEKLPISLELSDVIWISLLSISVTTVAGFFPAWRAVKVEPITAISYE
ncbi:MAG: ABC transporter permease [Planctomycetes bacterium]|nr:ABC transporter permease [Planctomycetota bacterium]